MRVVKTFSTVACAFLALLAVCVPAASQATPQRTVIRACRLLDVKTGNIKANQAIVIQGDKIVSVGPAESVAASPSDRNIDLRSVTVLAGLIDAHTHLTFNPHFGYDSLAISVPREAEEVADAIPVDLDALELWSVGDRLLRDVMAGRDPVAVMTATRMSRFAMQ